MSTQKVEYIHIRLREELERLGLSLAAASRAAGEDTTQRLRDVVTGRQKCPVDLLAKLSSTGVDLVYVLVGKRQETSSPASSALEKIDRQLMERIFNMLEQSAAKAGKRWTDKRKLTAAIEIYNFSVEGEVDDANIERALRLVVNH